MKKEEGGSARERRHRCGGVRLFSSWSEVRGGESRFEVKKEGGEDKKKSKGESPKVFRCFNLLHDFMMQVCWCVVLF